MINEKTFNKCESLKIFEQIVKIPRPSGKEEKMVDFLVNFAKQYKLNYEICGKNNIIIYKKATNKTSDKILILQSHIDMVCEKDFGTKIEFLSDGLETKIEDDFMFAKGTTLGADNGLGVAIILHILKSKNLKHCNLECVFTSEEETTMFGARTLDYKLLKGKTLLSLDGCFEEKIDNASAAMTIIKLSKNIECQEKKVIGSKITISGLIGGHSGEDIDKNRINAIKLATDIIERNKEITVVKVDGGNKPNAIPHTCSIVASNNFKKSSIDKIFYIIKSLKKLNNNEEIKVELKNSKLQYIVKKNDMGNLIELLNLLPNGVIKKDGKFVISSCNLAKVQTLKNKIEIILSVRSSDECSEKEILECVNNLAYKYGYMFKILNKVPGFEGDKNSYITKLCLDCYKNLYGKKITAGPVHAGLEGAVFKQHIKDLDICVIGVNIFNMHSTKEKASISSLQRVEKWVENILENF